MRVLIIDGHPASGRLLSALLGEYAAGLPAGTEVRRVALSDIAFDPTLHQGYSADQPWEPGLADAAEALGWCEHLVVGFPFWWGGEPAMVKGFFDRVLLPGFTFRYHRNDPMWDRLLAGRSADVIVTMDTPPWYVRLFFGDPVGRRMRQQVLGFCGFAPVRLFYLGPTRRGGAQKSYKGWKATLTKAARGVAKLKRGPRLEAAFNRSSVDQALVERQS